MSPALPPDTGRSLAIDHARHHIDSGVFETLLARRVAIASASRLADHRPQLQAYLDQELEPHFTRLGFSLTRYTHPDAPGPFLLAQRIEDPALPTVLQYGHGDVVAGLAEQWSEGLSPFTLTRRDGNWYGRGTADNKGQHTVNMLALESLLHTRGRLGFNLKYLIEMGEESGSPGLEAVCAEQRDALAADVFIASDGPRLSRDTPTLFLGARGGISFRLSVQAREHYQHSGNWGGLLSNPGIRLCHAITALADARGRILVPTLTPGAIPASVRAALRDCRLVPSPGDPETQPWWGEPGLSPEEKVYAWSSFDIMEMSCGNLAQPLYAIPPGAWARVQLRFPVGVDVDGIVPAVRNALHAAGFDDVQVHEPTDAIFRASRLDPEHPWVQRIARSLEQTIGRRPAILPNLGGSLPNNIFSDLLGLPTIWIPHSYPGCLQHAANEHLPVSIAEEGLALMAGLYWDLGMPGFADS